MSKSHVPISGSMYLHSFPEDEHVQVAPVKDWCRLVHFPVEFGLYEKETENRSVITGCYATYFEVDEWQVMAGNPRIIMTMS